MIKKILPLAMCVAGISTTALAKDGAYVSGFVGHTFKGTVFTKESGVKDKNKFKNATPFGAAVGYNLGDMSFDVSYTNLTSKYKQDSSQKLKNHFILANTYYNVNNIHSIVKPYVGGGLGVNLIQGEKNALAYQGVVGSKFTITPNLDAFVDYRLTRTRNITDGAFAGRLSYHSINAGLTYYFNGNDNNSVVKSVKNEVKKATKDIVTSKKESGATKSVTLKEEVKKVKEEVKNVAKSKSECLKAGGYEYMLDKSYTEEERQFFYNLLSKSGKC